ncbi:MAG: hypothetical protein Q7K03_05990 [Dehalococcoidia bacterium]|nr:hypothetical protein [Dehalococcoidia bacterium]
MNSQPEDQSQGMEPLEHLQEILDQLRKTQSTVQSALSRPLSEGTPVILQGAIFQATGSLVSVVTEQVILTKELAESSQRLETLTKRLNKFTWALIILTALLVAAAVYPIIMPSN